VSCSEVETLKTELKPFGGDNYVFFIDPSIDYSGVYSNTSFYLRQGFEINAQKNLVTLGEINIPEYNLAIKARGKVWWYTTVHAKSLYLKAPYMVWSSLTSHSTKPSNMPLEMWEAFKDFTFHRHGALLED